MSRSRQILMAGGTFSAAMAIGLVMLNGDALAAKFTSDEVAEQTPNIQIEQIPELAPSTNSKCTERSNWAAR